MNSYSLIYKYFFYIFFFIGLLSVLFYLSIRTILFIVADYSWLERSVAFLLLFGEGFILIQTVGYLLNLYAAKTYSFKKEKAKLFHLGYYPPIAIVVASYKEPLPILRDTLACFYNISYPNKYFYFLDDTRYDLPWDTPENKQKYRQAIEEMCQWFEVNLFRSNWHGAKAGKINDFLQFLAGNKRPDFEFYPYQQKQKIEAEKYLVIFDADMNPIPDFAEELVAFMEKNPKLAFIQTPQYYTNFETNRIARAAGVQQAIFYEYICEGKSVKNAMFCCGTNVVLRREALMDVGGFDETSVTEDFATSFKLHKRGWQSLYMNKVLSFGMGPEDLGAFFKQQFRWATGTVELFRKLLCEIWTNSRLLTISQWWEYFLSSTHYFIGLALFVLIICPVCYLLFNKPSYFANPEIYLLTYTPYFLLTSLLFFWTVMERKYRFSDLMTSLLINITSFPVYIKACFYAILGIKTTFGITPKGKSNILPFKSLIPQVITALICVIALTWGMMRLYYEREPFYAILANTFWTLFNFATLSSFLYLNHSEEDKVS